MTTNNIPTSAPQDALQAIRIRKAEVRSQLNASRDYIRASVKGLFAPPKKPASKWGNFMSMVDQGMAIYDGVMMGLRVAHNLRRIFRRRR